MAPSIASGNSSRNFIDLIRPHGQIHSIGMFSRIRCAICFGSRPAWIRWSLANRSLDSAAALAQQVGGRAVLLTELENALTQADIVICSTAADHYLLRQAQVRDVMAARRQKPLFLIDISVPRNLDPKIGALE